jgi:hypothetical protein
MSRKVAILQEPFELPATTTYAQPEGQAIVVVEPKVAVVVLEIYQNTNSSNSATISLQCGTRTKPGPYVRTNSGFVTPTGASFSVAALQTGTAQPITMTLLADLLRFNVTANTFTTAIRFSLTVYLTDA